MAVARATAAQEIQPAWPCSRTTNNQHLQSYTIYSSHATYVDPKATLRKTIVRQRSTTTTIYQNKGADGLGEDNDMRDVRVDMVG
jgi:hypothetical protein